MKIRRLLVVSILALGSGAAGAVPSTFEPVVGNAVLCGDHIAPPYFQNYLTTHFKAPYKTAGGAYWYKPDGAQLFGMEVAEIFVSNGADQVDFLGVIFNAPLNEARQRLLDGPGTSFQPDSVEKTFRSPLGSHLTEYQRTKSKLFCVKYRVGR